MSKERTDMAPGISVVVPVYNSESSLDELVRRLQEALGSRSQPFEILLVNDGSRDDSWAVIRRLAEREGIRGINLMRNFGQHNALLCGIRAAHYAVVVTLDDDLQNPPEEIEKLLAELEKGYDVVYGTPASQQHGIWRDLASVLTKLALQHLMGAKTARQVSAFRAFRTKLRRAFDDFRSPSVSIDVLLAWGAAQFSAVEVRQEPRSLGESNYTFRRLLSHSINMLTGFSTLPLHLVSWIGFMFTIFGVMVLVYVFVNYLIYRGSVPGFSFLASIIVIFSGAQLFTLGVIGEYLARIHWRTMDRPPFVVSERTDDGRADGENKNGEPELSARGVGDGR